MTRFRIDDGAADAAEWVTVPADPSLDYHLHYDFRVLGHDVDHGIVDFVLRFHGDGGHCQRHRHLADTTILVLEGEQHLEDLHPDGTRTRRVRAAGEYARHHGEEPVAHMERGGPEGALIYYSCRTDDGRLFEFVDADLRVIEVLTIDALVGQWQAAAAA